MISRTWVFIIIAALVSFGFRAIPVLFKNKLGVSETAEVNAPNQEHFFAYLRRAIQQEVFHCHAPQKSDAIAGVKEKFQQNQAI